MVKHVSTTKGLYLLKVHLKKKDQKRTCLMMLCDFYAPTSDDAGGIYIFSVFRICVRGYVRTNVRSSVRMCIRTYARTYIRT